MALQQSIGGVGSSAMMQADLVRMALIPSAIPIASDLTREMQAMRTAEQRRLAKGKLNARARMLEFHELLKTVRRLKFLYVLKFKELSATSSEDGTPTPTLSGNSTDNDEAADSSSHFPGEAADVEEELRRMSQNPQLQISGPEADGMDVDSDVAGNGFADADDDDDNDDQAGSFGLVRHRRLPVTVQSPSAAGPVDIAELQEPALASVGFRSSTCPLSPQQQQQQSLSEAKKVHFSPVVHTKEISMAADPNGSLPNGDSGGESHTVAQQSRRKHRPSSSSLPAAAAAATTTTVELADGPSGLSHPPRINFYQHLHQYTYSSLRPSSAAASPNSHIAHHGRGPRASPAGGQSRKQSAFSSSASASPSSSFSSSSFTSNASTSPAATASAAVGNPRFCAGRSGSAAATAALLEQYKPTAYDKFQRYTYASVAPRLSVNSLADAVRKISSARPAPSSSAK